MCRTRSLSTCILVILSLEKVVQHGFVTWAFGTDRFGIREDVTVDFRWLTAIGGLAAILFGVAAIGLIARRTWSLPVLIGLSLVDIVGEFIAQGTVFITLNVSFIVALIVLILATRKWRARGAADHHAETPTRSI